MDNLQFSKQKDEFFTTIQQRVDQYFRQKNISKHANAAMVLKSVFVVSIWAVSFSLILFAELQIWQLFVLWAIHGLFSALIGTNVGHDAIHRAYSANPKINKLVAVFFNLIGANAYMWNITHNFVHHTFTNVEGWDEDIESVPILRLAPAQKHLKIQKFQHIYAFFLYGFGSLSWVFIKDYKKFFAKNIGKYDNSNHPISAYFGLFGYKFLYYAIFVVSPYFITDFAWYHILLAFLLSHFVEGFTLAVIFMLAHVVEGPDFPMPDENGKMKYTWAVHQMHTTADFGRNNRLLRFITGGLNFQVEHHLFPKVCHVHYPAISKIVEKTAKEYGVPYLSQPSFFKALKSHIRLLKYFGQSAELEVAA